MGAVEDGVEARFIVIDDAGIHIHRNVVWGKLTDQTQGSVLGLLSLVCSSPAQL